MAFGNGRSGRRLSLRKVGRREAPDADFLNSAFEQQAVRNGMAGLSKELTTVHARKRFFNPGAVADKQLRYTGSACGGRTTSRPLSGNTRNPIRLARRLMRMLCAGTSRDESFAG